MDKSEKKINRQSEKAPALSGLIKLKLIQSSHKASKHSKIDQHYLKAMAPNINTPSTIADFKKFHSCELGERNKATAEQSRQPFRPQAGHRRCESSTKILTLREIKLEEDKSKQKEKQQQAVMVSRKSSKKLFVSIARNNSQSKEKKQPAVEMDHIDCNLEEEGQKRQKIKINVYKDMARKNTPHLK